MTVLETLTPTESLALACVFLMVLWQLFLSVFAFSFRRVLREHDD